MAAPDPIASDLNELTYRIIGAAMRVHEALGSGLLESLYQAAMEVELTAVGIGYEAQKVIPAFYRGVRLRGGYRIDLLVEGQVVVELKATDRFEPVFTAQVLTYLKLTSRQVGLLINFNVPVLKQGIKRLVNDFIDPDPAYPLLTEPSTPTKS